MSAIAGILTSANASNTDLVGEWMPKILVKQGRSANLGTVLLGFFAKLKSEQALNGVFNSFERNPVRQNFYSNAGANTSATSLTFDDGNGNAVSQLLTADDILYNGTTGEYVRVVSTDGSASVSTVVTVVRDFFTTGSTGVAITDNDVWSIITSGALEGSAPRDPRYEQPDTVTNYIQTFKESVKLSNYYMANQIRSNMEGPKQDAINYALETEANRIEKAFLIGQRSAGTAAKAQFTGGVTWAIDAAISADSNLSGIKLNGGGSSGTALSNVLGWLRSFMVNGSDAKLALCGDYAYDALSTYAAIGSGGFRIINSDADTSLNLNLTEIQTPSGKVSLARHPLLMTDTNFKGHMIVVDLGLVSMKVMEKLHYQEFEPANGTDAYQGQFRAKLGLQMNFANAFGYAYNLRQIN